MKIPQFIRAGISFTLIRYLMTGLGMVRSIYVARTLGPSLMGTLGLFNLVVEYSRFANFGIPFALNQQGAIGLGNEERVNGLRSNGTSVLFFICVAFALVGIAFSTCLKGVLPQDLMALVFPMVLLAVVGQVKAFSLVEFRLFRRFRAINLLESLPGVVLFIFVISLAKSHRLTGVVYAFVIAGFFTLAIAVLNLRSFRVGCDFSVLRQLATLGIPLLAYNLCVQLILSVDRVFVARYLSREILGHYTIASVFAMNTLLFLGSLVYLYNPKFLAEFNKGEAKLVDVLRYQKPYEAGIVGLSILGAGVAGPLFSCVLPQYSPSIFLYRVLIIALATYRFSYFVGAFLVARQHQNLLFVSLLPVLACGIGLNFVAVKWGLGARGIAGATLLSLLLYCLTNQALAFWKLGEFSWKNLATTNGRYAMMAGLLMTIAFWDLRGAALCLVAYLVLYRAEMAQMVSFLRRTVHL